MVALLAGSGTLNPAAVKTVPSLQLIDWGLLPRAALGVVALLAGNGYIVGINQIYDVDIDAVNKPFLPVAAGAYSTGSRVLGPVSCLGRPGICQ